jgi:hypothetical protein
LFIDSVAGGTVSSPCTAVSCTIAFSTTPGTHTFAIEIDDTVNVLAEGSASYTLVAGDNTAAFQSSPLTLNGVVHSWFLNATAAGTGSIGFADADGYIIESAAGNYDNGPLTLASNPAGATITAADSLTTIDLNGTIGFTYTCGTLAAPFTLVVSQAAALTPSIPLTLTSPLLYGSTAAPVIGNVGGLANSITCP